VHWVAVSHNSSFLTHSSPRRNSRPSTILRGKMADPPLRRLRSLAAAELYLALAAMFRRFEFELYETTSKDIEIDWDGFAGGFRPESKGVRVKVVGELQ